MKILLIFSFFSLVFSNYLSSNCKAVEDLIFITFKMDEDYIYDGDCPKNCPPIITGYTLITVDNRAADDNLNFCIMNYCWGGLRINQLTKGTVYEYIAVPKSTDPTYNCPKVNAKGQKCYEIYLLYPGTKLE
jgi:hypothetical protein